MTNIFTAISDLPPEQRAIRAKCFHPTGRFIEFKSEEIEQSIPDRFEQMVRLYPSRLAVKTKNQTLTYDELNKAANRVANAILAQRGEGQELIAVLLEHDAQVITAILGVLKAGKIYVPLNPSFPGNRISYLLDHSRASLIVTNDQNLSVGKNTAKKNGCQLLNMEDSNSSWSADNPALPISSNRFACVVYTSGSTGQPKGCIENHRNVLHRIMNYTNSIHICSDDRLVLVASCTVSAGLHNTYGALLNGAALFPFDVQREGVVNLAKWLNQQEITIYHSTSTVFRPLVSALSRPEEFPKLRLIRLGGESVSKGDVELYKKHFPPDCILVIGLGTSETATIRKYFIDKETQIIGNNVPVGYPMEDMKVLLLNDEGQEVSFNQIGAIAVKTAYLTPGYWRRPDLTRAAFLSQPKGEGEHIYRTGDLGLMRPDGCLEHHGRIDFQVKVRGQTVEVKEIEMMLLDHAAIKEAVVLGCRDQCGDQRLAAYLVPATQPAPTVSDLRRFLKEKLPDYMIPSVFVIQDALPLTPTGKVDRLALPAPNKSRPELGNSYVAPSTPVEKELAQIWAEVLSLDEIGIHDNFFDLGGHSLLATQVISRVINAFKVELPIKSLFESPTVADMAVVITENIAKKVDDEELSLMLGELESITNEEAQRRLEDEN